MNPKPRNGRQSDEAQSEELLRARRELAQVTAQLHRLQQRRSSLLAMAAHDLRTPLAIIQGYSQLLAASLSADTDAATREYLTTIVGHSAGLANTIENLVALDQMERGEMTISTIRCDLTELVLSALAQVEGLATVKGLVIHCETPPDPIWIYADEDQVGRVLYSLFSHGEKYARPGGDLRVEVTVYGGFGRVTLADPRRLLAAETAARLFDLVEIGHDGRGALAGTDMGLVVARHVAEAHGGGVEAVSSPEKGTVFTLYLPRSEA